MAMIYQFSCYAVDRNDNHLTGKDLVNALQSNYWFEDCLFHQVHSRESEPFELKDGDPVNLQNCDLKDIEKHFNHEAHETGSSEEVVIGGIYRHFKGKTVNVIAVARDTEYGGLNVIYYEPTGKSVWSRPLEMFMSDVDREKYPDVEQRKRFELIGKIESE